VRLLLVKTSSMGDVIHALVAVSDAARAIPDLRVAWVVEEAFAEIPAWHPAVERVIPVALRRWRRTPWRPTVWRQWRAFRGMLRASRYDCVLDAQGLLKSALVTLQAPGFRVGLDRDSAREPLAALAYRRRFRVARDRHAIDRLRALFAAALDYALPTGPPDYGLGPARFPVPAALPGPYLVFLHGTTWASKHYPEADWIALGQQAAAAGYTVCLPWGNEAERARAARIAAVVSRARVLERLPLTAVAGVLAASRGVVGVDTGLAQLAAALGVPAVTLFGATRPGLTGPRGARQANLAAGFACAPCLARHCRHPSAATPCYATLPPDRVWRALAERMDGRSLSWSC